MIKTRLGAPLALVLCSTWLYACSSSDSEDAGAKDSGTTVADAGPTDAAAPDASLGPCDPTDGTGCESGKSCVWVSSTDQTQCRTTGNSNAFETACSTTLLDCGPGLTCLQIEGEAGPTCHKVCDLQGAGECNGLTGASTNYSCASIGGATYGVCVGRGASCVPYDATSCPANQTCSLTSATMTSCAAAGTTQKGGNCSQSNCVHGAICINLQGSAGPTCYETCDPRSGMCPTAGDNCLGLQGVSFGLCQTPGCNVITNQCPQDQTCGVGNAGVECIPVGTTPVGGDCSAQACVRGAVCLQTQSGARTCFQPCDQTTTCTMGSCQQTNLPFGVCG